MYGNLHSRRPLVELLQIAKSSGAIASWSVEGRRIIVHTKTTQFSLPSDEAAVVLRQLIRDANNEEAD